MTAIKARAKRSIAPKHAVIVRAFRFVIETTQSQSKKLFDQCDVCCDVRNVLVEARTENRLAVRRQQEAGQDTEQYLTRADQYRHIAALVKQDRRLAIVHSQVLQNVAERVDKGYKAWLSHVGAGKAGRKSPPGHVAHRDYRSIAFPQYGPAAFVRRGRLFLSKLGEFRLNDYRKLQGKPKAVTVKFACGKWWAIITCALREQDVYRPADAVADLPDTGGDPGLSSLLTLADGTVFDPPRALRDNLAALRRAQRDMSRKFDMRKKRYEHEALRRQGAGEPAQASLREMPYSRRLSLQIKAVAKLHTRVANVRDHHHKKLARRVEKSVRLLAIEEHGVKFMQANRRLARTAGDRAIASFKQALQSALGIRYVPVASTRPGIGGNSQTCICNASVPKTLSERIHECRNCGLVASRDVVSANIIMATAFGRHLLAQPDPSKIIVPKEVKARPVAGPAVGGRTTRMRGGVKATTTVQAAVKERVPAGRRAAETPLKRKPDLPRGRASGDGEPAPRVKTPHVLSVLKRAALLRETNTRQDLGLAGSD